MIRLALAYLLVFAVFAGVLVLIRARITVAIVLLPLAIWPDITLLTGLGKMDFRSAWICRIIGMCALLYTYLAKFLGW